MSAPSLLHAVYCCRSARSTLLVCQPDLLQGCWNQIERVSDKSLEADVTAKLQDASRHVCSRYVEQELKISC